MSPLSSDVAKLEANVANLEERVDKIEKDVGEHKAIINKTLGAVFLSAFLIPIFTATLTAWVVKFWATKP